MQLAARQDLVASCRCKTCGRRSKNFDAGLAAHHQGTLTTRPGAFGKVGKQRLAPPSSFLPQAFDDAGSSSSSSAEAEPAAVAGAHLAQGDIGNTKGLLETYAEVSAINSEHH
jgi:hypothetical protein